MRLWLSMGQTGMRFGWRGQCKIRQFGIVWCRITAGKLDVL